MIKQLLLIISLFFILPAAANAQDFSARGTVMDENGVGMPNISISIKGSTEDNTVTDEDGHFDINVPEGSNVIVVRAMGYREQEVDAGDGFGTLDISMSAASRLLTEVTNIGYLPTSRKDVTGSITSVDARTINQIAGATIENSLEGRTSGVQIVQSSGAPGAGADVRVRGTTTINGSNQPLYIVDDVPVTSGSLTQENVGGQGNNALSQIATSDIASVEVLKDAASLAMYGMRGANGVVLITTKKGSYTEEPQNSVTFNTSYGLQKVIKKLNTLDTSDYYDLITDEYRNALNDPTIDPYDPNGAVKLTKQNGKTNYQNYLFQTGHVQDQNVSLTGGNAASRYYAGIGYYQNVGIMRPASLDRYSARVNLETKFNNLVKCGLNIGYTNTIENRLQNDNSIYGNLLPALLLSPDNILVNRDGSYASNEFGWANVAGNVESYKNQVKTNRIIGNAFIEAKLYKDVSFRTSMGADNLTERENTYSPATIPQGAATNGRGFAGTANITSYINEDYFSYLHSLGRNSISAVAGVSFQRLTQNNTAAVATNFPSPALPNLISGGTPVSAISSTPDDYGYNSYFLNIHYSYDNRFLLSVSFKEDGSSKFSGHRNGYFPGLSGAWHVSREQFMKSFHPVSDMKVRVGYGVNGNANGINSFLTTPLYGANSYNTAGGISYSQPGTTSLKWETTTQFNLGVDLGLFGNRIYFSGDFYNKKTSDMIIYEPVSQQTGFTGNFANAGSVGNTGWELAITTRNTQGILNWTTTINLSQNKNKVLSLYNDQPIFSGFNGSSVVMVGQPIGSFYGYQVEKVFRKQSEIDDVNKKAPGGVYQSAATAPGDFKFKDINGDGKITVADRTVIGNAQPTLFGGFGNNISCMGFELNVFCQFSVGNKIFNATRQATTSMSGDYNQTDEVLKRWSRTNTSSDMPRAVFGDPNDNARNSDYFIESGSYFRIKNVTLAYTLPKQWFSFSNNAIKQIRIYLSAVNLVTFTKYTGLDPEVNTFDRSSTTLGTDFATYPQAKSYTLGANFTF